MLLWALAELSTLSQSSTSSGHAQGSSSHASRQSQVIAVGMGTAPGTAGSSKKQPSSLQLPPGFLEAVLEASKLTLPSAGPQALSNTLWALAKLRSPPPADWLDLYLARSATQLRDSAPQALANTGWALATLGPTQRPPAAWRAAFLDATAAAAPYSPPASLAQAAWAAARLRLAPGQDWGRVVQDASLSRLSHFKPQDLANTSWALASLQLRPSLAWMDAMLKAVQASMRQFSAAELGSVIWSLAVLGYHPGEGPMRAMLAAFAERMPTAKAQTLSSVLWALARMRVVPDGLWMEEWLATLSAELGNVGPQELAVCWWALGTLRVRPPPSLAADMVAELRLQQGALQGRELVMVLVGHARLGSPLPKEVLDALLSRLVGKVKALARYSPAHATRTATAAISALAHMAHTSGGAHGRSQGAAVRALLSYMAQGQRVVQQRALGMAYNGREAPRAARTWGGGDVAVMLQALARLRQPPPREWTLAALQAVTVTGAGPLGSDAAAAASEQSQLLAPRNLAMAAWGAAALSSTGGASSSAARSRATGSATAGGSRHPLHLNVRERHAVRLSWWPQRRPDRWGSTELTAWAHALTPHLVSQPRSAWAQLRMRELAMLLWALAHMCKSGRRAWQAGGRRVTTSAAAASSALQPRQQLLPVMGLLLFELESQLESGATLSPRDLSIIMSALATVQAQPSSTFLARLLGTAAAEGVGAEGSSAGEGAAQGARAPVISSLARYKARELCHTLWAAARLGAAVPPEWLLAACTQLQAELQQVARSPVPAAAPPVATAGAGASRSAGRSAGAAGGSEGGRRPHSTARAITAAAPGSMVTSSDCEMAARALRQLAAAARLTGAATARTSGRGSARSAPALVRAPVSTAAVMTDGQGDSVQQGTGAAPDTASQAMRHWAGEEVRATLAALAAAREACLQRARESRKVALVRKLTHAQW